ncbi:MAG: hypothetical protein MZV63_42385 [Marinilabiliales bacterium]|nr:hypothetical protein [Marinilabiliales bacterium]
MLTGNTGDYDEDMTAVYFNDFWEWDQATDEWTRKADLPGRVAMVPPRFQLETEELHGYRLHQTALWLLISGNMTSHQTNGSGKQTLQEQPEHVQLAFLWVIKDISEPVIGSVALKAVHGNSGNTTRQWTNGVFSEPPQSQYSLVRRLGRKRRVLFYRTSSAMNRLHYGYCL